MIWLKKFGRNCFWLKAFSTENFIGRKTFRPNIFSPEKTFGRKLFFGGTFVRPKNVSADFFSETFWIQSVSFFGGKKNSAQTKKRRLYRGRREQRGGSGGGSSASLGPFFRTAEPFFLGAIFSELPFTRRRMNRSKRPYASMH